jgi:hypothetical protein
MTIFRRRQLRVFMEGRNRPLVNLNLIEESTVLILDYQADLLAARNENERESPR